MFFLSFPILPNNITETCNHSIPINEIYYQKMDENICPLECNRYLMLSSTSSDLFPTRSYAQEMLMRRPDYFERLFNKSADKITYEMIRENFVSVSIRFSSLTVTDMFEDPAITFVGLISNLGGIAGLFLAVSFLSFMEFVDLGISVAIILCKSFSKN